MKKFLSVTITGVMAALLLGCNSQPSFSTSDSLSVATKYVKDHPEAAAHVFYTAELHNAQMIVGKDSLVQMHAAYLANSLNIKDTSNNPVTGYLFDAKDFTDLVANSNVVKTVCFQFGIRNYNYVADHQKPYYTLTIVPMGAGGQTYPGMASPASTLTAYGYDFVQPCPGSPGCPPGN